MEKSEWKNVGVCVVGGSRPVYVLASTGTFVKIDTRFGTKLSGSKESIINKGKRTKVKKERFQRERILAPMMLTLLAVHLCHCQFETIAM